MRLSSTQISAIRTSATQLAGLSARIWLFGSRVRDDARGGDVDLLLGFAGQPKRDGLNYRLDPGRAVEAGGQAAAALEMAGFKNADLALTPGQMLENIHAVQRRQNLPLSGALVKTKVCDINLDVEMETGTGKTYCYVKSVLIRLAPKDTRCSGS